MGFIVLVNGTLIYNEIYECPCEKFSYNTKKRQALREAGGDPRSLDESKRSRSMRKRMQVENNEYVGLSPHAGYDAKRSMRAIEKKMEEEAAAGRPADVEIMGFEENG